MLLCKSSLGVFCIELFQNLGKCPESLLWAEPGGGMCSLGCVCRWCWELWGLAGSQGDAVSGGDGGCWYRMGRDLLLCPSASSLPALLGTVLPFCAPTAPAGSSLDGMSVFCLEEEAEADIGQEDKKRGRKVDEVESKGAWEDVRQAGDRGLVPWGSGVPSKQFAVPLKERVVSCQKEAQLWFAVASFCCPSSTPCPACSTCPCACAMLGCDFPPLAVWCDQLFSFQRLMSFYMDTDWAWTLLFLHLVLTRELSVGPMTWELNPLIGVSLWKPTKCREICLHVGSFINWSEKLTVKS